MADLKNRQWLLASRPEGMIKESNFRWNETSVPAVGDGQVLVRNLALSFDPTQRGVDVNGHLCPDDPDRSTDARLCGRPSSRIEESVVQPRPIGSRHPWVGRLYAQGRDAWLDGTAKATLDRSDSWPFAAWRDRPDSVFRHARGGPSQSGRNLCRFGRGGGRPARSRE